MMNGVLQIKILIFLVLANFCFFLNSCATTKISENQNKKGLLSFIIKLDSAKNVELIETSALLGENLVKTWKTTATSKNKSYIFFVTSNSDKKSIFIKVDDENSNQLASFLYDAETSNPKVKTESKDLKAKDPILIFQWIFYSPEKVAQVFEEKNLKFTIETQNDGKTEIRRVYNKRKCVIKITKEIGKITYQNFEKEISLIFEEI